MKRLLLTLLIALSCTFGFSQGNEPVIVYQDWQIVYNNNCEQKAPCMDFYYALTRSKEKVYNYQDRKYYYYYYLIVQSNSTYQTGGWAYTKLDGVSFYLNGTLVHYEPYVLFREQKTICIFWHDSDANAQVYFKWKNISIY